MRRSFAVTAFLLVLWAVSPASAGETLARIHVQKTLRCGAVERPGIAEELPDGRIGGIAADLCKAAAGAVLGPDAAVSFTLYDAPHDYDALRTGADELAFLTGSEIADAALGDAVVPGPVVAVEQVGVMVHEGATVQGLADLAGRVVCVMTASRAQRAFQSATAALEPPPAPMAFQEDVEMLDAYNAGSCMAVAGEVTYLAAMRRNPGVARAGSRLLPEPLASDPILAVTPRGDSDWTAAVAWVFNALLLADAPSDAWTPGGAAALPARAVSGLRETWYADVTGAVGSYAAIVRRNFGVTLGLPPGPNALWPAGALLPSAVR